MFRISIFFFLFTSVLFSCNRENPDVVNAQAVGEKKIIPVEEGSKSDELRANSVSEGDVKAVAKRALQSLQEAYKRSSGKVPDVGDVTVMVDDNLNLLIENKSGLSTTTTQVNLASIDTDFKNIEIMPDKDGNKFPGFRIKTLSGKPKVAILKNGTKEKEMDYLEIYMSSRDDVHKSLSSITLAAQAAQNTLPESK